MAAPARNASVKPRIPARVAEESAATFLFTCGLLLFSPWWSSSIEGLLLLLA